MYHVIPYQKRNFTCRAPIDHMNMNTQVDFMKGKIASPENLAISVYDVLDPHIRLMGIELHCIKIVETENNYVEYYGN